MSDCRWCGDTTTEPSIEPCSRCCRHANDVHRALVGLRARLLTPKERDGLIVDLEKHGAEHYLGNILYRHFWEQGGDS
jgi:hypothetical protein